MTHPELIIEDTGTRRNLGVFTRVELPPETVLGLYGATRQALAHQEFANILLYKPYSRDNFDFVETILGRYMNHSEDTNVYPSYQDGRILLVTHKVVSAGEELLYNYNDLSEFLNISFNLSTDTTETSLLRFNNFS